MEHKCEGELPKEGAMAVGMLQAASSVTGLTQLKLRDMSAYTNGPTCDDLGVSHEQILQAQEEWRAKYSRPIGSP